MAIRPQSVEPGTVQPEGVGDSAHSPQGRLEALELENEVLRQQAAALERGLAARTADLESKLAELDRKNAELLERRSLFNAALETAGLWVVTLDLEGRIVRCNRRCGELAGMPAEALAGLSFSEAIVPPAQRAQSDAWLRRLAEPGREPPDWELTLDDGRRIINWFGRLLTGIDGPVAYLLAVGRDVTEQRRVEEEVRQRRAEVAHLHRVYTAGEMAAALAHELNQPLTAIAAYAEAAIQKLQNDAAGKGRYLDDFERIAGQCHRAARTIADLRRFLSKGSASRARPCELNELIRAACELMNIDGKLRSVRLELDLAADLPPVMAEAVHVEHVLTNLILNALDALSGREERIVRITSGALSDTLAQVTVHDNGDGVPASERERIFEAFRTTKETGLGMGLPISRSIIEAHGGRLWVEPSEQGGSFRFTLPFAHGTESLPRR